MEEGKENKIEENKPKEHNSEEHNKVKEHKEEKEVVHEKKDHKSSLSDSHKSKENLTEKMRENPWVLSTAVLGILSLILIVGSFSGGMPETIISEADAGKMILDFANSRVNEEVKLIGVETFGNHLYEVTLSLEGQYIPLYITKDGVNFVQGAMSMNTLMKKSYLEEKEDIPSENSEIEEIPEFNNTELNYSG